ncbi:hypothetical protein ASA1KI_09400 [Opitutales bacterium ASA1]|uniref:glycosyltransferase n=1 Tax=Congregicoccus parvus TaxID=3081749 RepID=UPI002B2E5497|nr:hypothetical protein ASA1KI_09400 [Opitutales bacterium ASA1]
MVDGTLLLPNYNNAGVLPEAFAAIRRNLDCSRLHLVAVDDGSEDGGAEILKVEACRSGFASVEILERRHEGIVHALNAGLAAVRTPFVYRIDGDALVQTPGWTDRFAAALRLRGIGLIGGHTIFDSGLVHGFGRSVLTKEGLHDEGTKPLERSGSRTFDCIVWRPWSRFPGGSMREVDTVLATCVGFRLEDALAVGGFDRRFNPVWIEDDDFGLSMRRMGLKVFVDPGVRILHCTSRRGKRLPETGDHGARAGIGERLRHLFKPTMPLFDEIKGVRFARVAGGRQVLLRAHYGQWREKWGFDPLNPDMDDLVRRWTGTELAWRWEEDRAEEGRRLGRVLDGGGGRS